MNTRHLSIALMMTLVCGTTPGFAAVSRILSVTPADGALNICPDTLLRVRFDDGPVLGRSNEITIASVSGEVVDRIDLSLNNRAEAQPRNIGGAMFTNYPVLISGNEATICPHLGVLKYGQAYRVTLGAGVFAGITNPVSWTITTKATGPAPAAGRVTVAADGSGDFCTVQGALDFVPAGNMAPRVIFVRPGIYEEILYLTNKPRVTLLGEDRKQTVIQYANNEVFNYRGLKRNLYRQTIGVDADEFTLQNLSVRNTTRKGGSQAEALRIDGRRCIVNNVDFHSFQDTLKLSGEVFIRNCYVEGDVDFIWGFGTCYFTNCEIKSLNSRAYLTQIRNDENHFGDVFVDCRLTKADGVSNAVLSRIEPGRFPYSHVAWINCAMGDHVRPDAWQVSPGANSTEHIRFWEYKTTDLTGTNLVDVSRRAAISRQLTADEAAEMRDARHVFGDWDPNVPE